MGYNKFVVGFAFVNDGKGVLLISKEHPPWQKGLLNGIGGAIEVWETSREAMKREFKEETGTETELSEWKLQITEKVLDTDTIVFFYSMHLNLDRYKIVDWTQEIVDWTQEWNEKIVFVNLLDNSHSIQTDPKIVNDLSWIIPLCLDKTVKKPLRITKTTKI